MSGDRRPSRRAVRRVVRAATLLAVVATGTTLAWAWSTASTNPATSVTAVTLLAPANAAAAKVGDCTGINVSWDAVVGADRYRIRRRTANAAFTTVAASHATTTYADGSAFANRTVTYEITPLVSGSSWEGAPAAATVTCGLGEITDLAVTNPCSRSVLTWSAITGATSYDVYRTVNGAASGPFNVAATTWADTTVHPNGAAVAYRVQPRSGGGAGNDSNVASLASWTSFHVTAVTFANAGTANTHDSGDSITVTFSKPADTGNAATGTIWVQRNGNPRGAFFAAGSASAAASTIGAVEATFGNTNDNRAIGGAITRPNTQTWRWTSTNGLTGPQMTVDITGQAWTPGTGTGRVSCAGEPTTYPEAPNPPSVPVPTLSGRW